MYNILTTWNILDCYIIIVIGIIVGIKIGRFLQKKVWKTL